MNPNTYILPLILLAGITVSQAEIIYSTRESGTYSVGALPQPVDFDFDEDGSVDFSLQSVLHIVEDFAQGYFYFSANPESRALILSPVDTGIKWLAPIDRDTPIGSAPASGLWGESPFGVSEYLVDQTSSEFKGPWINSRGYWGFAIQSADGAHYGWMEIEDHQGAALTVHGFAYEQAPGAPIPAGAVPEPSTGILMLSGLTALLLRRRAKLNR